MLSDAQQRASNPKASIWLSANAGSGKTSVLVSRLLKLLLQGERAGRILCLTYTKTAAGEMAGRVQQKLGDWMMMQGSASSTARLDEELQAIGLTPTDDLRQRARRLFLSVAEDPEGLKIKTLHSFCQSILSRFPLEAGIAPSSQPLEEEESIQLCLRLKSDLLYSEHQEAALNEANQYLLLHHHAEFQDSNFINNWYKIQNGQGDFQDFDNARNLEKILKFFDLTEQSFSLNEQESAKNFYTLVQGLAISEVKNILDRHQDELKQNSRFLWKGIDGFLSSSEPNIAKERAFAHWLKADRGLRKKLCNKDVECYPVVLEFTEALQKVIQAERWQESKRVIARYNQHFFLWMAEFAKRYEAYKRREGLLDYRDQIHLVQNLLNKSSGVDWIRYKLDCGIHHLFIDEAQDNSPAHWKILEKLTEDFYAQEDNEKSLFVVGDPKQSIYRFQGAEPAGFYREEQRYQEQSAQKLKSLSLLKSYRSAPAILRFVDQVFSEAETQHYPSFKNSHHQAFENNPAGKVVIAPMPIKLETSVATLKFAKHLAKQIGGWIGKRPLYGQDRLVKAEDIMVLFSRRSPLFKALSQALKKEGVAVISGETTKLCDPLVIADVLCVMRYILSPSDDYMLACALKSSFIGVSEQALFDLSYRRGGSLHQALYAKKDSAEYKAAYQWLHDLLSRVDFAGVNTLLADILYRPCPKGKSGIQALLGRLGSEALRPLQRLESMAILHDQQSYTGVQGFVDAVYYRLSLDIDRVEGRGAVRVMTMHSAKGLEAPIVILPEADAPLKSDMKNHFYCEESMFLASMSTTTPPPSLEGLWSERQRENQAEYWRLWYVAMTRAEGELYVYRAKFAEKKSSQKTSFLSAYDLAFRVLSSQTKETDYTAFPETLFESSDYYCLKDSEISPRSLSSERELSAKTPMIFPDWLTSDQSDEAVFSFPKISALPSHEQSRGTALHHIIADLSKIGWEKTEERLPTLISRQMALSSDLSFDDLEDTILRLQKNKRIMAFLEKALIEQAVCLCKGGETILRRVDAIVIRDQKIQIVDFKSDAIPSNEIPKPYILQLQEYAEILTEIYPNYLISAAIVWLADATWHDCKI